MARPGEYVAGYRLGHKIDEGGLGAIFAIDEAGEDRVIKLMHTARMPEGRAVHESKLGAVVGGKRFPKVYASGTEGDFHYLVMERIDGWNLAAIAGHARHAKARFSIASVTALIEETLLALHGLHEAIDPETGIPLQAVHRDVKLSNVMLRPDGRVCLIDLGVGKSNVQTWRTRTGALVGTLGYISPEQATGELVDRRADLYAVGVMLYALLTFLPYVEPGTPAEMVRRMHQQTFVPPSAHRSDVPPALDAIVERALARRPEDRYADATAMRDALARDWPAEGVTILAYAETHLAKDDAAPTRVVAAPRIFRPTESLFEAKEPSFVVPLVAASLLAAAVAFGTYSALAPDEEVVPTPREGAPGVTPRATTPGVASDETRAGATEGTANRAAIGSAGTPTVERAPGTATDRLSVGAAGTPTVEGASGTATARPSVGAPEDRATKTGSTVRGSSGAAPDRASSGAPPDRPSSGAPTDRPTAESAPGARSPDRASSPESTEPSRTTPTDGSPSTRSAQNGAAPPPAPPSRPVRSGKRRPPRAGRSTDAPPPSPSAPPSIDATVDALVARAEALRTPEQSAAIDDIIADAALWRRAKDEARARAELARLARRLEALR